MTEPISQPQPDGLDVCVITYNEDGNEKRVLPSEVSEDAVDWSRSLGIGADGDMVRIDHGPFVAAESELRVIRLSSLAAAVDGNYEWWPSTSIDPRRR